MIENNLQAVIEALSLHIRDFRGQFTADAFQAVCAFCREELAKAVKTLAPAVVPVAVPAVVPVAVEPVPTTTPVEEVKT